MTHSLRFAIVPAITLAALAGAAPSAMAASHKNVASSSANGNTVTVTVAGAPAADFYVTSWSCKTSSCTEADQDITDASGIAQLQLPSKGCWLTVGALDQPAIYNGPCINDVTG
jgi:hypothetical protein